MPRQRLLIFLVPIFLLVSVLFIVRLSRIDLGKVLGFKALCDDGQWQYIYHPNRLRIKDPCKTVTGVIELIKAEPDGDYHIRLKPDAPYANLVNGENLRRQKGDLVLEPVCENPVTQADALETCKNFKNDLPIPPIGSHVEVTGPYVLDSEHGWMEIHPLVRILVKQLEL